MNAPVTIAATQTSPILAMHHRYEAAWEEYNRVDVADTALGTSDPADQSLSYWYQTAKTAKTANNAETDALRQAILYQVPATWPEAMILLFHVHSAHGLTDKPSPEEFSATETALDTLLDFICCKADQDHEAIGKHFQNGANRVFDKRRYRTGMLED